MRSRSARSTVSPPNPESKTPIFKLPTFRDRFRSQIDPRKVGMSRKRLLLASVDEKSNLRDGRKIGVQSSDDRQQGECLWLDSGGMGPHKCGAEVDYGHVPGVLLPGTLLHRHQEDLVDI